MKGNGKKSIAEILADDEVIDRAMGDAVMDALRRHKLLGNPVAEWRDGRVVWIAPEDIQIEVSGSGVGGVGDAVSPDKTC